MEWTYQNIKVESIEDIPEGVVGFVYLIVNEDTQEYYIGKKNIWSYRKLPPLKGSKRKRKVVKESDWIKYQSSNDTVKGWNSCRKEIIHYCYTPKELTYRETEALFCLKTMEDERCLNSNILGKFYPKDIKKNIYEQ